MEFEIEAEDLDFVFNTQGSKIKTFLRNYWRMQMNNHILKIDADHFEEMRSFGFKHSIRLNDRKFLAGDAVTMKATVSSGQEMKAGAPLVFSGFSKHLTILRVYQDGYPGLLPGYCLLIFR